MVYRMFLFSLCSVLVVSGLYVVNSQCVNRCTKYAHGLWLTAYSWLDAIEQCYGFDKCNCFMGNNVCKVCNSRQLSLHVFTSSYAIEIKWLMHKKYFTSTAIVCLLNMSNLTLLSYNCLSKTIYRID